MSDLPEDNFLSSKEAAHMLGLVPDYVSRLCRQGKIHAVREGRSWAIKKSEILRFQQEEQARKAVHLAQLSASREREYEEAETRRIKETQEVVVEQSHAEPEPLPSYELWIHEESEERRPVRGHAFALSLALIAVVFTLHVYLPSSRTALVATVGQALGPVASVLPERSTAQREVVLENKLRITTPVSFGTVVALPGAFLARTSDVILAGHARAVHVFVTIGQKTPERVLVLTYTTGAVTTTLATNISDALLHQSFESNVLGIVGHVALAYDTLRDSLRGVYAYRFSDETDRTLPASVFEATRGDVLR